MDHAMALYRQAKASPRRETESMSSLLNDPTKALTEYVSHPSVSADPDFSSGIEGARNFACKRLGELAFR